ncbi:hypothetical protein H5410_031265 [Solanum commersonii]|uniref:DUF7588 domain-containing protein n=1 Tax=Solanum commersonii TaxID=4109 RepID=A0A9J5YJE2_SOLCO|nr:hypothetical protein H5410_031265 [Solanum commersonii]
MDLGETSNKSTRLEEVDIPQNLDLLNRWTIPKVPIKTIYDYGWFDKLSSKELIKTTEQSLALNSSEQTIHLLNKRNMPLLILIFLIFLKNPEGRISIQFADNSFAPHRQSFGNNRLMSSMNHSYNRHSLSSHRLLLVVHHISPIKPIYGPARDRAALLHTIVFDGNPVVEKVKIDPRTNIVQVNDDAFDKDIHSTSEMKFDLNDSQCFHTKSILAQFKTWFFDAYSKEDLNCISQEFCETCALHNQIMYFVPWFITTYLPLYINVIERTYKDGSGNLVIAIYPPQSSFVLPNNTGITFSTFQKFIEEDIASISIAEINKLITQNNYLSLYVKVLGEHISSLDKKLDDLTILIKDIKADMAKTTSAIATNVASTSESKPSVASTYIQRTLEISDFKPSSLKYFEELLDKKFSDLDIKNHVDRKLVVLNFQPMDLSQDFADKMESTGDFKNQVYLEFNKLKGYPKKNSGYATKPSMNTYYYPHPTPQDVLVEKRDWN